MFSSLVVLALVSSLSTDATPFLCGTDPATRTAMELCIQRVELDEMQTLYRPEHPAVGKRQRRVRAMEHALEALRDQGYQVDEKRVDGVLDALLQWTKARWRKRSRGADAGSSPPGTARMCASSRWVASPLVAFSRSEPCVCQATHASLDSWMDTLKTPPRQFFPQSAAHINAG